MRSVKNYLLLVLAVMVLGLAVLTWKQHQELVALRATAMTSGERADWQKRVWAAQKRAQGLESELAAARAGKSTATAVEANEPGRDAPPRPDFGRAMAGFANMMDRPEAARLLAIQQKAQVDARYAALFKKLGLSADKLAQLKSLLSDRLSTAVDVMMAASQQGINPMQDPQAVRQLVQNARAEIDSKIQALLDPGSYSQYQSYVQTEPQRAVVNQLEQSLSYTANPLSPTQADQLVQILAATTPAPAAGASGTTVAYVRTAGATGGGVTMAVGMAPADAGGGGGLVTDAAIAQAQSVLSAAQLQALQQIQQQQQAAAQLRQQMIQSAAAAGFVPPPPPPPAGG